MLTELVSFRAEDGVVLDGAYYDAPSSIGALVVHGKTTNFYTSVSRFLPPSLVALGVKTLAINRRGHDVASLRDDFYRGEGGAWELLEDAQTDIRAGLQFLRERGARTIALIGHSYGAYSAVRYAGSTLAAGNPENIMAVVSLSAMLGGFSRAAAAGAEKAQQLVSENRGRELIALPGWWWFGSAESLLEMVESPPLSEALSLISCPLLFLYGSEEKTLGMRCEELCSVTKGPTEIARVEGANHFYSGHEEETSAIVTGWLQKALPRGGS